MWNVAENLRKIGDVKSVTSEFRALNSTSDPNHPATAYSPLIGWFLKLNGLEYIWTMQKLNRAANDNSVDHLVCTNFFVLIF